MGIMYPSLVVWIFPPVSTELLKYGDHWENKIAANIWYIPIVLIILYM